MSNIPREEYGEQYFQNYNYADRKLSRFSMYWFARRYYAALVRRFAPQGGDLLEIGTGLGHLLGLLQDDFNCVGIDIDDYPVEQTRRNAPRAEAFVYQANDLSIFEDGRFAAIVSLHVFEHLPDPAFTLHEVRRVLQPGGVLLFATPNPGYSLRRFKDHATDAIGKDPTHINVQPPEQWRAWLTQHHLRLVRHFGDGLWDVPYLPVIPKAIQFGVFGLPALAQVMTRTTFTPLPLGVNQIIIAYKTD